MNKALIVVDMQNDFIDGALGTPEAEAIVDNVKAKIEAYRKNSDAVIFTRDTHSENYMGTQEGSKLPVPHCIEGSYGWQIRAELEHEDCLIIDKPTFGSYELVDSLRELDEETPLESIELIGLCTDICVISNAMMIKAAFLEIPVIVDASCCAGVTPASHDNALDAMGMCQIEVRR